MATDRMLTSFAPVIAPDARVIILGSMPGELSLQTGQYYAHPRNLFWPIMQDLLGISSDGCYEERLKCLTDAGIGLWDVLQHCERRGSLDSSIREGTEVANDFGTLFNRSPSVRALCFNGKKAERAFHRLVLPSLPRDLSERLDLVILPSTSPANAAKARITKVEAWKVILDYIR